MGEEGGDRLEGLGDEVREITQERERERGKDREDITKI